ncbi:hypothetical protein ABZ545_32580 [Streptomyces abikoensis]|uniref:hypothetical protein n=1 Tax=Streptomyces TaxID=1883 RepID=UPI0034104607
MSGTPAVPGNSLETLPDCATVPVTSLVAELGEKRMGGRIAQGQDPVLRPVFGKFHGVARGVLTVDPALPPDLSIGFLRAAKEKKGLAAWVRFSSDVLPDRLDLRRTAGVGIKLFGVPGPKLMEQESRADPQDLVLQNQDIFFVDTARNMCEFQQDPVAYRRDHPVTHRILREKRKPEESVLTATYWGVLLYAFGTDRHVKYKLVPAGCAQGDPHATPAAENSFLRGDLQYRPAADEVAFDLLLQFRTDPDSMPLDRATVRWGEIAERPGEGGEADPAPAGRHGPRPGGLRGQLHLQPLAQPARAPTGRQPR